MRKLLSLLFAGVLSLGLVTNSFGALTKTSSSVTDWTAVATAGVGESAEVDISDCYESTIHIQAFLTSITAHTGTEFVVQGADSTSGNEGWQTFTSFVELVGTSGTMTITNNPAAVGTTVFTSGTISASFAVVDKAIRWVGIEDNVAIASSELGLQVGYVANTSITVQDGSTVEHSTTTEIWGIAFTKDISIPLGYQRVRVIVNNDYDSNGSALDYKVHITEVTGL